jgi:DNA-binding NarL/FixJ family response regulator
MEEHSEKLKLFIIDDSDIFRSGLAVIFGEDEKFELSGCCGHSDESEENCAAEAPNILLLHASAHESDERLQIVGRIKKNVQGIRVLVIAEFTDINYLLRIVASGCDGYVHASISGSSPKRVVKNLADDICIFDRTIIDKLLLLEADRNGGNRAEFSPRELRIVEMLAEGRNNAEIGKEMLLSAGTVKNIISGMLRRRHLKNRVQLIKSLSL